MIPIETGLQFLVAGVPIGLVGCLSAILQGKVAAAGGWDCREKAGRSLQGYRLCRFG